MVKPPYGGRYPDSGCFGQTGQKIVVRNRGLFLQKRKKAGKSLLPPIFPSGGFWGCFGEPGVLKEIIQDDFPDFSGGTPVSIPVIRLFPMGYMRDSQVEQHVSWACVKRKADLIVVRQGRKVGQVRDAPQI